MKQYLLNVLIALDQLANVLLAGAPDETLSARAYRAAEGGKVLGLILRPSIDFLFLVLSFGRDNDHCATAYASEVQRRQYPHAYGIYVKE